MVSRFFAEFTLSEVRFFATLRMTRGGGLMTKVTGGLLKVLYLFRVKKGRR